MPIGGDDQADRRLTTRADQHFALFFPRVREPLNSFQSFSNRLIGCLF